MNKNKLIIVDSGPPMFGEEVTISLRFVSFGDTRLDALAATQKPPRTYTRTRAVLKEQCPSCGRVEFLRKGHYATLCEGCHGDIERLAVSTPWYGGVGGTAK